MDQLEALYMGNYESWALNSEEYYNEENSTSITELNSLPSLTTLQLIVSKSMILLELEESFFERLKRFHVSIGILRFSYWGEYSIIRNSISQYGYGDLSLLSHTKLHYLVRKTQYLKLEDCKDEGSFIDEGKLNAFHNLETLEIRDMKILKILKSFSQEWGNQRVSFPNLDKMKIKQLSTLEKVVGSQMQDGPANKLRILRIYDCKNLKNFVDSPTLQNLEDVYISECKSMEAVFDLEGLKVEGEIAPFIYDKLTSIKLLNLPGLTHVWRMPRENIQGFQNLRTFKAKRCIKLRYLLTESMAKMLVNLQVLKVELCNNIVVMIEGDDEGCSSEPRSKESIVFPQLKVLRLDNLPGFTSFCSSKYSFEFPLLDEVRIRGCPDMKTFCSGAVNAPVLEEPVEDPEGGQWFWKGNLNKGTYRERTMKDEDE